VCLCCGELGGLVPLEGFFRLPSTYPLPQAENGLDQMASFSVLDPASATKGECQW
jgi:hypothetical protein